MTIYDSFRKRSRVSSLHLFRQWLRRTAIVTATFFLFSPLSLAQEIDDIRTWTYLFGGIGSCNHGVPYFHVGGGGEGLVAGGFGFGAELGYLAFAEAAGRGVGLLSPGVVYNFSPAKKTMPFVTGGYTLFFRSAAAHGFYFGGGINRWAGERWGFRIEGRNQLMPACRENLLEARFALLFR